MTEVLTPLEKRKHFNARELAELLGVCKATVHLWSQNGTLRHFSQRKKCGTLRIPRKEVVRLLRSRSREVPGLWTLPPEGPRILVIDEFRPTRLLAKEVIKDSYPAAEVRTSKSPENGLVLAARLEPDIVLLDAYYMDYGNSWKHWLWFLVKARSLRRSKVIGMTNTPGLCSTMIEEGAAACVDKSRLARDLVPILRKHWKRRARGR